MSEYSLHIRYKKIVDYAEFSVYVLISRAVFSQENGAFFFILNHSLTNTLLDENHV